MGNLDLEINFSFLFFDNITFTKGGALLNFKHQISKAVTVSDSNFTYITSGSLEILGSISSKDKNTGATFQNCEFSNILSYLSSFITVSRNSNLMILNSQIFEITTLFSISGAISASDQAQVEIQDSSFFNNSAIIA